MSRSLPSSFGRAVPQRQAGVLDRVLDGEAVVYLGRDTGPLLLNASATAVWALVDGVATVDDIVAAVAAAYGVEPSAIADDVVATVGDLAERGALDI